MKNMDKYFVFRKLMDFMADYCDINDADMNNYAGDIEITGIDEDGCTINLRVKIEEVKNDGN